MKTKIALAVVCVAYVRLSLRSERRRVKLLATLDAIDYLCDKMDQHRVPMDEFDSIVMHDISDRM